MQNRTAPEPYQVKHSGGRPFSHMQSLHNYKCSSKLLQNVLDFTSFISGYTFKRLPVIHLSILLK